MRTPIRTISLGLLLACGAIGVQAKTKVAKPAAPVVPAAPLDLSLAPAATPQTMPLDLGLRPATPAISLDPALRNPMAQPSTAYRPIATQPSSVSGASQRPVSPLSSTARDPASRPAIIVPSGTPDPLQSASSEVRSVARWVIDSRDNAGMPFVLIDKANAQVFVFTPAGLLQGMAPALLGMGHGDRMLVPNDTKMSAMPPQVRITPAGRFVSQLTIDSHGKELLVLDYDASLSLHAVVKGTPAEHRAERLNSPSSEDNRISFGCINVPTTFYSSVVSPAFTGKKGIVYVLPETAPASQVFGFQPAAASTVSAASPQGSAGAQGSAGLSARSTPTAQAPDAGQPRLAQ